MTKEKVIGIYCIENKINGKKYVGQSRNIYKRWNDHRNKNPQHISIVYRAISKYGLKNFQFIILEKCSINNMNKLECYWIKKLNTISPNGYNLTSGGNQNVIFSKEHKTKIRKARLGKKHNKKSLKKMSEIKFGENNHWYKKDGHTEESKNKISMIVKNYYNDINNRIKAARNSMNGYKIGCSNGKIYLSRLEAALDNKVHVTAITKVYSGIYKTANGLKFWRIPPIENYFEKEGK